MAVMRPLRAAGHPHLNRGHTSSRSSSELLRERDGEADELASRPLPASQSASNIGALGLTSKLEEAAGTPPTDAPEVHGSVQDVIEGIGFGPMQVRAVVLAGVVWLCQGTHLCLLTLLTRPIAEEFHLGPTQKALLTTFVFIGMFFGALLSGFIGDRYGRRKPVVFSANAVALNGLVTAFLPTYGLLLAARLLLGVGIGVGFSSGIALLSELTPKAWRIPVRSMTDGLFDIGYTYAAAIATYDDPELRHLHWRLLLLVAAVPAAAISLLTALLLPESPVYLAARGRDVEARQILQCMRAANNAPGVSLRYQPEAVENLAVSEKQVLSFSGQLGVVFSGEHLQNTVVLSYAAFVLHVFYYGGLYAQPQVAQHPGSAIPAGWQVVIGGGPVDIVGLLLAVVLARHMEKKRVLALALWMASFTSTCFALGGSSSGPQRPRWMEGVYLFGCFGFYWVPAVAFVVLWQVAVEEFPVTASATGCSVAMAAGRIGGILAPLMFESAWAFFGHWAGFCYVTSVVTLIGAGLLLLRPAGRMVNRGHKTW